MNFIKSAGWDYGTFLVLKIKHNSNDSLEDQDVDDSVDNGCNLELMVMTHSITS